LTQMGRNMEKAVGEKKAVSNFLSNAKKKEDLGSQNRRAGRSGGGEDSNG